MAALADTPTISASSSSAAAAAAAAAAVTAHGSAMGTAMHEEFKREAHEELGGMGNGLFPADLLASPKIRLTPTIKLMPSPNATDPKRKFICPYEHCTKSYGKSSHLRSHLTWHTGVKPFVCHEAGCGKGFTRSDELNRHVRTHTGEKPFECLQCGKKFSRSDHLTKHLATHAKQMQNPGKKTRFTQPQVASANGAASRWAEELVERKPQITPQQALFNAGCHTPDGIDFNDGMHFMAALMSSAKAHPVARDAYGEPENLAYNGHALDHAPIKIKLERPERGSDYHVVHDSVAAAAAAEETEDDEDDDQGPMIKVVSTMVCPSSPPERKFSAASAAAAHNSDDDYDDPEDDAIMPEANVVLPPPPPRVVSAPSKPAQPVLTGDPERPYGCNQCEKSFKRQDDLSRHMRTHSGEKPYECGECHKRFMRSDHLKKHQKTHNKAR